jgi:hypothetical protein
LHRLDLLDATFSTGISQVAAASVVVYSDIDFVDEGIIIEYRFGIVVTKTDRTMIGRALLETNLFVDHICRKGLFVTKVNNIAL